MVSLWNCLVWHTFHLFATRVIETPCIRIAVIHDDHIDLLQPTSDIELWITTIFNSAKTISCPTSIDFTTFPVPTAEVLVTHCQLFKDGNQFEGFILLITRCQIGDVIELNISPDLPSLRVDFAPCPPPLVSGLAVERVPFYRMNENNRYACSSLAVIKWLDQWICSMSLDDTTKNLLLHNEMAFSVNQELQDCSSLHAGDWTDVRSVNHRYELYGKKMRLVSLERFWGTQPSPYMSVERDSNGIITGYRGYLFEIIHALQTLYNYTYEVEFPVIGKYGNELANGSWDGMIGMILDQNADVGVGAFSVIQSRYQVVDFTVGFYQESSSILIPPPIENHQLLACTKPFRLEVWLALALFVIILPGILWQHFECLWIHSHQEKCPLLANQYFFVLGVLVGQSGQKLCSVGYSPRLLGAIWCLTSVVFASAYIGILMSFLRFPKLSPIVTKLEQLPTSHLKWAVLRGTALDHLFTEATTGVYKTIGEELIKNQRGTLIDVNDDFIRRVTEENYAYIGPKSNLESALYEDYVQSGTCRLSIVKQDFFKVNVAFALPKGSPLKPLLDKKILQMMEAGLGIYWKKMYWPPSKVKCDDFQLKDVGPKSLQLTDLQGAFLILIIGYALAIISFLTEQFC